MEERWRRIGGRARPTNAFCVSRAGGQNTLRGEKGVRTRSRRSGGRQAEEVARGDRGLQRGPSSSRQRTADTAAPVGCECERARSGNDYAGVEPWSAAK